MSKLAEKLLKASSVSGAAFMSESVYFNAKDTITTELPILNLAFSGEVDGGFPSGITIVSGESKTFKSLTSLYCLKAYLDKYKDAIGIIYDTEYGISLDSMRAFGVDPTRVIHIPVEHIEQLKFDFIKKLETIERGDHVFFLLDSIGQISSKKETDDAHDEKSVADMTRAKALRSLFRLVTLQLVKKNLPCFMVNHVYVEIGAMYPKTIIPGGTAVTYSAEQIFVITKSQEKDSSGELEGWNFNINIHKSRIVKEKSKFSMRVLYEDGIKKYSGLLDLAVDSGIVIKPSNGWYQLVDMETGEVVGGKVRAKDTETDAFLGKVIQDKFFKDWCRNKFKLGASQSTMLDADIDAEMNNVGDEE